MELVTAAGEVVRASADEHPDLFWAVRGGGGNFGVATWLEYELYPVGPTVTGGLVAHPFAAARDVLRFYRDFTASLPDELTAFAGVLHAPDGSGTKLAAIIACHGGSLEAGAAAVAPVKRFGSPVMDVIGPMPYTAVNMLFDAGFPRGALNYWKSNFLAALGDAAIDTMIERFAATPSPMSGLLLEHFHGAATRVGPTDTAFPHRAVGYNFLTVGEWVDASRYRGQRRLGARGVCRDGPPLQRGPVRQLPERGRGGRGQRGVGRVRAELEAVARGQATV